MALQKTHTTAQGVSANYWRLELMRFDFDGKVAAFDLHLYKDSTARSNGDKFLESSEYFVRDTDFDTWFAPAVLDVLSQNPQERAYEYLKTLTTPVDFTTGTTDV